MDWAKDVIFATTKERFLYYIAITNDTPINNTKMTYSEAIKRIEAIITQMEATAPMSIEDYAEKEKEVRQLLKFCKKKLGLFEKHIQMVDDEELL